MINDNDLSEIPGFSVFASKSGQSFVFRKVENVEVFYFDVVDDGHFHKVFLMFYTTTPPFGHPFLERRGIITRWKPSTFYFSIFNSQFSILNFLLPGLPHSAATLAGLSLQLHLSETERDARADGATDGLGAGSVLVVRVRIFALTGVPVEDVVHVQMDGNLAVEKVGTQPAVDAVARLRDRKQADTLGTIIRRGVDFQHLPQLGPEIEAEAVAEVVDLGGFGAVAEVKLRLGIIDIPVKTNVHKRFEAVGDIQFRPRVHRLAGIHGLRETDNTSEDIAVGDIAQVTDFVVGMFVVGTDAHRTELLEKLGPACLNRMSESLLQAGISNAITLFVITDEGG